MRQIGAILPGRPKCAQLLNEFWLLGESYRSKSERKPDRLPPGLGTPLNSLDCEVKGDETLRDLNRRCIAYYTGQGSGVGARDLTSGGNAQDADYQLAIAPAEADLITYFDRMSGFGGTAIYEDKSRIAQLLRHRATRAQTARV